MGKNKVPRHIAIIMDGNGRWAQKRMLPRVAGHKEGAESFRIILKTCVELGVKYLTVYAFSTENWKRPKPEVAFLMRTFSETIDKEIDELDQQGVRINYFGQLYRFSDELQKKMKASMDRTKNNDTIVVNAMVSYGSRAEMVRAVNQIIKEGHKEIDEKVFADHLYTKDIPDPDLLIRTASEMRISNFLLWQIAYTELYITPTLFPDFRKDALIEAIESFQKRVRKFGKTAEQLKEG